MTRLLQISLYFLPSYQKEGKDSVHRQPVWNNLMVYMLMEGQLPLLIILPSKTRFQ